MGWRGRIGGALIVLVAIQGFSPFSTRPASGQANCAGETTGNVPVNDLADGLYLGEFEGGLYPGGVNVAPAEHLREGTQRGRAVTARDAAGYVSATGKYVLLSIGMSSP